MRTMFRNWAPRGAMAVTALLLVVALAACGKSVNASASTAPSPSASATMSTGAGPSASGAAAASITADWQRFFSGATSAAQKIGLLQQGQQYAQTIRAQAASAISKATSVKVTSVDITSPTSATVTYDIMQNGQTVLSNVKGQAVLESGTWKVSAKSFQDLLNLEQGQSGASPSATP